MASDRETNPRRPRRPSRRGARLWSTRHRHGPRRPARRVCPAPLRAWLARRRDCRGLPGRPVRCRQASARVESVGDRRAAGVASGVGAQAADLPPGLRAHRHARSRVLAVIREAIAVCDRSPDDRLREDAAGDRPASSSWRSLPASGRRRSTGRCASRRQHASDRRDRGRPGGTPRSWRRLIAAGAARTRPVYASSPIGATPLAERQSSRCTTRSRHAPGRANIIDGFRADADQAGVHSSPRAAAGDLLPRHHRVHPADPGAGDDAGRDLQRRSRGSSSAAPCGTAASRSSGWATASCSTSATPAPACARRSRWWTAWPPPGCHRPTSGAARGALCSSRRATTSGRR